MSAGRARWRPAALLALALVAELAASPAFAEAPRDGQAAPLAAPGLSPPPPAAPPRQEASIHRRRPGLITAGAIVFGLSWGGAVFLSAALINARAAPLHTALDYSIPILGPAATGPAPDERVMFVWSAAQLAGALMLIYGLKGEDVPADRGTPPTRADRTAPDLQLAPLLASGTGGMALLGRW